MKTDIRSKVESWLRRLGCTPVEVKDTDNDWHIRFDYPVRSQHMMHAVQPKGSDGRLTLAFMVNVAHEHLKAFETLDLESREQFLRDLFRSINSFDVDFNMGGVEKDGDCPTHIQLMATRYDDGLTMDSFARSVGAVFKTFLTAVSVIQNHLGGKGTGPGRFDFRRLGV